LPTVIIALITAIVLLILYLLANLQKQYLYQAVEKSVQIYYFAFLFVQIFFVVLLSTGIATIIEQLPSTIQSVPAVLAESLPKASNYFFLYITIYTIGTVTAFLLQINTVLQLGILSPVLDQTPRQK
jgi:calcium permeable stress-gated cation channel